MAKVLVKQVKDVTVITINRAAARNAVDRETSVLLRQAFLAFDSDATQRVAVLTGSEKYFCAGADLKSVAVGGATMPDVTELGPMGPTALTLRKPVIAAIEGPAVAGGLELAIWADLRVAARSATFGVFCRRFGVPLIDGGTIRLPRLIGQSRAADMILTGREVTAREAFEWGLVNRLVDDGSALDCALRLAEDLSRLPQTCMRNDRQSSLEQWSLPLDAALKREMELGRASLASGEAANGAKAFASGRGRGGSKL